MDSREAILDSQLGPESDLGERKQLHSSRKTDLHVSQKEV